MHPPFRSVEAPEDVLAHQFWMTLAEFISVRCRQDFSVGTHHGIDEREESRRRGFVVAAGSALFDRVMGVVSFDALANSLEGAIKPMLSQVKESDRDVGSVSPFTRVER